MIMNYYKDNSNSIRGYFELENNLISEYHSNALKINTAINALEYILIAIKVQKIYLSYYSCDVLLEPLKKLQLQFEFYIIDLYLETVFDFSKLNDNEFFLHTNYFGLKYDYLTNILKKCKNLIIDNFNILHKSLGSKNKLNLSLLKNNVLITYPFCSEDLGLRKRLLENKNYTTTYWTNEKSGL